MKKAFKISIFERTFIDAGGNTFNLAPGDVLIQGQTSFEELFRYLLISEVPPRVDCGGPPEKVYIVLSGARQRLRKPALRLAVEEVFATLARAEAYIANEESKPYGIDFEYVINVKEVL